MRLPIHRGADRGARRRQAYLVQDAERACCEHQPENAPFYDVLLGQLGRCILGNRLPESRALITA
jgi:hypothetical protein